MGMGKYVIYKIWILLSCKILILKMHYVIPFALGDPRLKLMYVKSSAIISDKDYERRPSISKPSSKVTLDLF